MSSQQTLNSFNAGPSSRPCVPPVELDFASKRMFLRILRDYPVIWEIKGRNDTASKLAWAEVTRIFRQFRTGTSLSMELFPEQELRKLLGSIKASINYRVDQAKRKSAISAEMLRSDGWEATLLRLYTSQQWELWGDCDFLTRTLMEDKLKSHGYDCDRRENDHANRSFRGRRQAGEIGDELMMEVDDNIDRYQPFPRHPVNVRGVGVVPYAVGNVPPSGQVCQTASGFIEEPLERAAAVAAHWNRQPSNGNLHEDGENETTDASQFLEISQEDPDSTNNIVVENGQREQNHPQYGRNNGERNPSASRTAGAYVQRANGLTFGDLAQQANVEVQVQPLLPVQQQQPYTDSERAASVSLSNYRHDAQEAIRIKQEPNSSPTSSTDGEGQASSSYQASQSLSGISQFCVSLKQKEKTMNPLARLIRPMPVTVTTFDSASQYNHFATWGPEFAENAGLSLPASSYGITEEELIERIGAFNDFKKLTEEISKRCPFSLLERFSTHVQQLSFFYGMTKGSNQAEYKKLFEDNSNMNNPTTV